MIPPKRKLKEHEREDRVRYLFDKYSRGNFTVIPTVLLLALPLGGWSLWSSDPDCGSSDTQKLVVQIAKHHPGNKLTNYILQTSQSVRAQMEEVPSKKLLLENAANQKAVLDEANQNSAQMFKAADSIQLSTNGPGQASNCAELISGANMLRGVGMAPNVMALLGKAVEMYQEGKNYWRFLGPGNLANCVEPLAPYFIKDTQLQRSLSDLKNQQNNLMSQIKSELETADQNIRESATYWLDSIRTTAKDSDIKAVSCAARLNVKIGDDSANVDITFKVETTTEGKLYVTVHDLVDAYQVGVGYQDNSIGGQAQ